MIPKAHSSAIPKAPANCRTLLANNNQRWIISARPFESIITKPTQRHGKPCNSSISRRATTKPVALALVAKPVLGATNSSAGHKASIDATNINAEIFDSLLLLLLFVLRKVVVVHLTLPCVESSSLQKKWEKLIKNSVLSRTCATMVVLEVPSLKAVVSPCRLPYRGIRGASRTRRMPIFQGRMVKNAVR